MVLYSTGAPPVRANRAYKAEVNLATPRSNASLIEGWNLKGKTFFSLTVLRVGTGTFSIRQVFADGSYVEYSQDELADGYILDREFMDLRMTNTSQSVVNPRLIVDWRG